MNIRVEPTTDMNLLRSAMTHPATFKFFKDDGCPSAEEIAIPVGPNYIYLACWDDDLYLGLFLLVKANHIMWQVHNCMMPVAMGPRCRESAKKAIQWMWDNTTTLRLFGYIPANNPMSIKFTADVGFEMFGVNKKAIMKDGELVDLMCFGLSKE